MATLALDATARQRKATAAIRAARIFQVLGDHAPFLAGTIPLDIELPQSDLDILCEFDDGAAFERLLVDSYGGHAAFRVSREPYKGADTVVCTFELDGEIFEIFGQKTPVLEQDGYRHFVAEARLLEAMGDAGRTHIRDLKRAGLKTEPAFKAALGLPGDAYDALRDVYFACAADPARASVYVRDSTGSFRLTS